MPEHWTAKRDAGPSQSTDLLTQEGTMTTMLTDKGPAFAAAWPHELAERTGLSVEYVADALNAVINSDVPRNAFYRSEETGIPVPEVAALTGPVAAKVVTTLRTILDGINAISKTHCGGAGSSSTPTASAANAGPVRTSIVTSFEQGSKSMKAKDRNKAIKDGVARGRSVRSYGHREATTSSLIAGWHRANDQLSAARTEDAVFRAALSREWCATVLRDREVTGPWS